ncbi:uncharacterized protein LOC112465574 [Temnothorax curvispinosus]|uniref:Uncharacterized protein LOC112465574 n=1 Tax=Temnothorax curvispinosus TaxID=300111 RepID=A0A6J1R1R9_9HYME|nr:uncharacterized protein LOC112465574 [Temnothorax curvispinosus]
MDNEKCVVYVRYLKDREKEICPLSFVYGFEKNPDGVKNKGPEAILKVFWSPNEEDSPSSMAKKVSEIPHYTASATINKKPGYYEANVLRVAESELELEKQLDESGRSKRFKTPSLLAVESRATDGLLQQSSKRNISSNKRKKSSKNDFTKTSKNDSKMVTKTGKKGKTKKESAHTVLAEKFVTKRKKLSWSKRDKYTATKNDEDYDEDYDENYDEDYHKEEEESSDDSDDDVMPKKLHVEAMQDKAKKIKSLETKIKKLEKELEEIRTLNILYQKEYFSSSSANSAKSHVEQLTQSPPCTIASSSYTSSLSSSKTSLSVSSSNEERISEIAKLNSPSSSKSPTSVSKCAASTPVSSRTSTTNTLSESKPSACLLPVSVERATSESLSLNTSRFHIEDSFVADNGPVKLELMDTTETQEPAASAMSLENIKEDKILIHENPAIWVPVVGWEKIKVIAEIMYMDPSNNNETGDKAYIYALAQHMFGTEKLLTHVISSCNVQKKKFLDSGRTAPPNKFLEKDLLAAIYGAQMRRYYILNKESADPKSERITPTKINYYIGRKAFNLKKSEKARQERLARDALQMNNQLKP